MWLLRSDSTASDWLEVRTIPALPPPPALAPSFLSLFLCWQNKFERRMSDCRLCLNEVFSKALPLPTHGRFLRISTAHCVALAKTLQQLPQTICPVTQPQLNRQIIIHSLTTGVSPHDCTMRDAMMRWVVTTNDRQWKLNNWWPATGRTGCVGLTAAASKAWRTWHKSILLFIITSSSTRYRAVSTWWSRW